MTSEQQLAAYAAMVEMLDRIHHMLEMGEDINGTKYLFDEIGCLIAQARGHPSQDWRY